MHSIHREAEGSKAKTPPANTKRVWIAAVKKVNKAVTWNHVFSAAWSKMCSKCLLLHTETWVPVKRWCTFRRGNCTYMFISMCVTNYKYVCSYTWNSSCFSLLSALSCHLANKTWLWWIPCKFFHNLTNLA